jgi:hypothetical protein
MRYIRLRGKHCDKFAMIDDKHFDLVSKYNWYFNSEGYAIGYIPPRGRIISMHKLILPSIEGKEIDHRDGNKLNNRNDNLRYATRTQNHANRHKKSRRKYSNYKGVGYRNDRFRRKPWKAVVCVNGKVIRIGDYSTEEEAVIAYNQKATEVFGEYAYLNVLGASTTTCVPPQKRMKI